VTRAAVYVRLSQETAETTSPQRQREACTRLVADRGWTLHGVFEDLDISGYSGAPRPAFARLLDQLDQLDVVVVWKLDRLYRRFVGFVDVLGKLETAGVELVSATESLDTTTPMGKGVAGIIAAQAEQESANTSLRTRSAIGHLERQGRWRGGRRPYGWAPVDTPDGRRLTPVPAEAEVIREVAGRLVAGESARHVAIDLNRRGVPTATGRPWNSTTLLQIARSPRLVGRLVDSRHQVKVDGDGRPLPGPPAILDETTFARLQRALTGIRSEWGRRSDAALLSGLVRCSLCGRSCHGWAADHPQASYVCHGRSDGTCKGVAMLRRWVDGYVVAAVLERLDPDTVTRIRAERAPSDDPEVARRRVELDRQLDRLEEDRLAGLYDDDPVRYRRLWRDVVTRRDELVRREQAPVLGDVVPVDFGDGWWESPTTTDGERRAVLRAVIDRVELAPVTVRGRFDPHRIQVRWAHQLGD
jgi:site-specific DNA recombinase